VTICVISGSHRPGSQSGKVALHVMQLLDQLEVAGEFIDLAGNPLPLWDERAWHADGRWPGAWTPLAQQLRAAEGFVFVVPEWGGMVPSGFKNFLLFCGNRELGHKPALIVAVSASGNGAYPVAELRMASGKNNHVVYIPDHVIVRYVERVLNGDASVEDQAIRERLHYSVRALCGYARCMAQFRREFEVDHRRYGFGM